MNKLNEWCSNHFCLNWEPGPGKDYWRCKNSHWEGKSKEKECTNLKDPKVTALGGEKLRLEYSIYLSELYIKGLEKELKCHYELLAEEKQKLAAIPDPDLVLMNSDYLEEIIQRNTAMFKDPRGEVRFGRKEDLEHFHPILLAAITELTEDTIDVQIKDGTIIRTTEAADYYVKYEEDVTIVGRK